MYLQCTILLDRLVTCLSPSLLCAVIVHPFVFVSFSILSVKFMTPSLSRSRASPADSAFCSLSLSILIFFLSLSPLLLSCSLRLSPLVSFFVCLARSSSINYNYVSLPPRPSPSLSSTDPPPYCSLPSLSLSHSQLVRYL